MVDTALGRLGVQVRGSGDAMMFWPSLLMTGDMWAAQADHFGDRHRVIMVDPSGHGKSEKLTATFDFADCARCIVDILDALGENRTHFVGKPTTFATRPDVVAHLAGLENPQLVNALIGEFVFRE
jgi:3-oxoadipate enol-lactonase